VGGFGRSALVQAELDSQFNLKDEEVKVVFTEDDGCVLLSQHLARMLYTNHAPSIGRLP
jgi:hypothetical protein